MAKLVDVATAAQVLRCSERSVWRRIASGKLPVEKADGRTLVDVEPFEQADQASDMADRLSVMAGAQMAQREQDRQQWSDALSVVSGQYESELRSTRRGRAAAVACCGVLLIGLAGGAWWARDQLANAEDEHRDQLAEVLAGADRDLARAGAEVGRAEGRAAALVEQLDNMAERIAQVEDERDQLRVRVEDLAGAEAIRQLIAAMFSGVGSASLTAQSVGGTDAVNGLQTQPVAQASPASSSE